MQNNHKKRTLKNIMTLYSKTKTINKVNTRNF